MLILLLLLGVVFSSSVPLPTTQELPSSKEHYEKPDSPSYLTNFQNPEVLLTGGSATSPSSPSIQFASELATMTAGDKSVTILENGEMLNQEPMASGKLNDQVAKFESFSELPDQDFDSKLVSTSLIKVDQTTEGERNVELQKERLPRNSLLPPLVFAQQPSDISLEPTEVEAPGTTPTTVSMILNPIVLVQRTFGSPPIASEIGTEEFDEVGEDINGQQENDTEYFLSDSSDMNYHISSRTTTTSKESLDNRESTNATKARDEFEEKQVSDNKSATKGLIQNDDPRSVIALEPSDKRTRALKMKAVNNTFMLVHEKEPKDSTHSNSTVLEKEKNNIDNFRGEAKINDTNRSEAIPQTVRQKDYGNPFIFNGSLSKNENFSSPHNSNSRFRESKRIVTAAELLLNKSKYKNSVPSNVSKIRTSNQNLKEFHHEISERPQQVNTDGTIDQISEKSQQVHLDGTLGQISENPQSLNPDEPLTTESNILSGGSKLPAEGALSFGRSPTKQFGRGENSNIETREVNNDSFFVLIESELSSKKIKKDDPKLPKNESKNSDAENGYRMDVITSSSEVTYKQFDPLKNNSYPVINFANAKKNLSKVLQSPSKSKFKFEKQDNEKVREEVIRVTTYSPTLVNENAGRSGVPNPRFRSNVDGNQVNASVTEQNVTSLPSQTSVVEPLRVNASSSLSEVILPSSPPKPKLDEQVANTLYVESDAVGRSPLEVSSEDETSPVEAQEGDVVQTPPVQQERVSIQISEQVSNAVSIGCIIAIVSGVLLSMLVVGGATAYFLYQRLEGFRPKILSSDRSCANSDSGGYLDDQCRVAYVNSQIDLPKSTPEDLVSLDNDSFLNSLESMTIQNLWTDSIRHTKL